MHSGVSIVAAHVHGGGAGRGCPSEPEYEPRKPKYFCKPCAAEAEKLVAEPLPSRSGRDGDPMQLTPCDGRNMTATTARHGGHVAMTILPRSRWPKHGCGDHNDGDHCAATATTRRRRPQHSTAAQHARTAAQRWCSTTTRQRQRGGTVAAAESQRQQHGSSGAARRRRCHTAAAQQHGSSAARRRHSSGTAAVQYGGGAARWRRRSTAAAAQHGCGGAARWRRSSSVAQHGGLVSV